MGPHKARHIFSVPIGNDYYEAVAWLTIPEDSNPSIQVLVPGTSYTHSYWDWGIEPDTYSYVDFMTARGFPTLMFDRLGTGASSHPPSTEVSVDAHAKTLHVVLDHLRTETMGRYGLDHAVVVGHSLGSIIARVHAHQYPSFDAAILTGILPVLRLRGGEELADGDPRIMEQFDLASTSDEFSGQTWANEDFVTKNGLRGPLFYWTSNTDPAVLAFDELTKDTVSQGEIDTGGWKPTDDKQEPPCGYVVGQYDALLFDSVNEADIRSALAIARAEYPDATMHMIPDAGHNLNLHLNAQVAFDLCASLAATLTRQG